MAKSRNRGKAYVPPPRHNPEQIAQRQDRQRERLDNLRALAEMRYRSLEDYLLLLATFANHDFKNVVLSLEGIVAHLKPGQLSEQDIADLDQCARQLRANIEDYARLSMLNAPEVAESFEVGRLGASLQTLHRIPMQANDIAFRVQYDGLTRQQLVPHPLRTLIQAVNNLVINATHALREVPNRTLLLTFAPLPDTPAGLLVRVSDTGPGVAPEVRERIFDVFFSTRNGTGVGLPHVRKMLEPVGGTVTLEDAPEPGYHTTFTLRIPPPIPAQ